MKSVARISCKLCSSLVALLTLGAQGGGLVVGTTGEQRAVRQPPVITRFALDDGASSIAGDAPVVLAHSVVGATPTAFRVSARGDFAGAMWRPYRSRPTLERWEALTTPGCDVDGTSAKLKLFFQVRATLGDSVHIVDGRRSLVPISVESNVFADSICVARRP